MAARVAWSPEAVEDVESIALYQDVKVIDMWITLGTGNIYRQYRLPE